MDLSAGTRIESLHADRICRRPRDLYAITGLHAIPWSACSARGCMQSQELMQSRNQHRKEQAHPTRWRHGNAG